jgi:hypothetical protein
MSKFDDDVKRRRGELLGEYVAEAKAEQDQREKERLAVEALAARLLQVLATDRLTVRAQPAEPALEEFARFVIEIRHRSTDTVLGHVLRRDLSGGGRFDPTVEPPALPSGPSIGHFVAPLVTYRDREFEGYASESVDELDPRQLNEDAFLTWLFDELVELTAIHEQDVPG